MSQCPTPFGEGDRDMGRYAQGAAAARRLGSLRPWESEFAYRCAPAGAQGSRQAGGAGDTPCSRGRWGGIAEPFRRSGCGHHEALKQFRNNAGDVQPVTDSAERPTGDA